MAARLLAAPLALVLLGAPALAGRRPHLPPHPSTASLLAAGPIAPNGTLIHDAERLRTLELDELAPLRLRFTARF